MSCNNCLVSEALKESFSYCVLFSLSGERPVSDGPYDVTAMLQLSYDRLNHLFLCIKQWQGPMQIVMYGTDAEIQQMRSKQTLLDVLEKRRNIAIHVVYKRMVIPWLRLSLVCLFISLCIGLLSIKCVFYLPWCICEDPRQYIWDLSPPRLHKNCFAVPFNVFIIYYVFYFRSTM